MLNDENNTQLVDVQMSEDLETGTCDVTKLTKEQIEELGNRAIRFKDFKHISHMLNTLEQYQSNLTEELYHNVNNEMERIKGTVDNEFNQVKLVVSESETRLSISQENQRIHKTETIEYIEAFRGQFDQMFSGLRLMTSQIKEREEAQLSLQEQISANERLTNTRFTNLESIYDTKFRNLASDTAQSTRKVEFDKQLEKLVLDNAIEGLHQKTEHLTSTFREHQIMSDKQILENLSMYINKEKKRDIDMDDIKTLTSDLKKSIAKIDKDMKEIHVKLTQVEFKKDDSFSQISMNLEQLLDENNIRKSEFNNQKIFNDETIKRMDNNIGTIQQTRRMDYSSPIRLLAKEELSTTANGQKMDLLRQYMTNTKNEVDKALNATYKEVLDLKSEIEDLRFGIKLNLNKTDSSLMVLSEEKKKQDRREIFFSSNGLAGMDKEAKYNLKDYSIVTMKDWIHEYKTKENNYVQKEDKYKFDLPKNQKKKK